MDDWMRNCKISLGDWAQTYLTGGTRLCAHKCVSSVCGWAQYHNSIDHLVAHDYVHTSGMSVCGWAQYQYNMDHWWYAGTGRLGAQMGHTW
jgi:hypothetical protein